MENVQTRLARDADEMQAEVDVLRDELRKHQDPQKMQLIQEMISVCTTRDTFQTNLPLIELSLLGPYEPNVPYSGAGNGIGSCRPKYYEGYSATRSCEEESND